MRNVIRGVLVLLAVGIGLRAQDVCAQVPTGPSTDKTQESKVDLTEGLLDLLNEPADKKQSPKSPERSPEASANPVDGEDIGQAPASPLVDVETSMHTLAEWLRGGSDVKQTKSLQRDVVLRLDDLISQLEQQSQGSKSSQSSSSTSTSNSTSSNNSAGSNTTTSPAPPSGDAQAAQAKRDGQSGRSPQGDNAARDGQSQRPNDGNAAQQTAGSPGKPANNQPGKSGVDGAQPGVSPLSSRSVVVELNDPTALQRSAWGKLPERTREQMQSRMVERFLPGYREEIEAYYRALVQ